MSNYHTYSPYIYDHNKKYYIVDNNWFNDLTILQQNELKLKFNIGEMKNLEFPHVVYDYQEYWEIYKWYNCLAYDFGKYVSDIASINKEELYLIEFSSNEERKTFGELFFKDISNISKMERINK
jgi:hypothetical protein